MSSIEYVRESGDDFITELDHRWAGGETAEVVGHIPARHLRLTTPNGTTDDPVEVAVVSGIQVARDNTPADVLAYDGDCVVAVAGQERTVTLTDGTATVDVQTDQPVGETVLVEALDLVDHPARADTARIEEVLTATQKSHE
jgi:hypothetical protein